MCGRYTSELEFSQLRLAFDAADETFRPWTPTYNISPSSGPGHEQPLVRLANSGHREIRLGRFWFIPPSWNRPLRQLPTLFNARAEELERKRTWKLAYETNRCLIPATGWREFVGERSPKQPYHFSLNHPQERSTLKNVTPRMDGELFAFAGLCSSWTSPEGEVVWSFAIITTEPSQQAALYHNRMPLIMPKEQQEEWLTSRPTARLALREAMSEARSRKLRIYPTAPRGNDPRFEGPQAIVPLSDADVVGEPRPVAARKSDPAQLALPLGQPEEGRRS